LVGWLIDCGVYVASASVVPHTIARARARLPPPLLSLSSSSSLTKGRKFLEPSSFLNVEVTDDQRYLLQPTASDVLVGNILEDSISIGQNAKKKIPKCRINMIAGNIASYSRVLNNEKSLVYIAEANLLSTCLSTISAAKEVAKDTAKEKREQEQKSREGKKAGDQAAFEENKAELCEELENDLNSLTDMVSYETTFF
jgi:hypothetical protein